MALTPPQKLKSYKGLIKWLNEFRQYAIAATPLPGYGIDVTDSPGGRAINTRPGAGGGGKKTILPFHLVNASSIIDGARVRVYYGTVNSVEPTGMTSGDVPPFYIAVADGNKVYLQATWSTSGGNITALTIAAASSLPADDTTDNGVYHLEIGSVSVNSVPSPPVVTPVDNLTGSQSLVVCRDWFTNPAVYSGLWSIA